MLAKERLPGGDEGGTGELCRGRGLGRLGGKLPDSPPSGMACPRSREQFPSPLAAPVAEVQPEARVPGEWLGPLPRWRVSSRHS